MRLGADAAVLHAVLFQDGVTSPHSVGHAVHRHGALLHDLQQCGLRFRGGTVDLIGEQQLAVCRTVAVLKVVCFRG